MAGAADDRLSATAAVDLRLVHSSSPASFLDGGDGALRFDSGREGLRLGRAYVAARLRLADEWTLHGVLDAYGDHDRNAVDTSELWLGYRPFPSGPVRWQLKLGAFYLPASLENRGPGWRSVYTLTPSAINSWIGEELRTIGAEAEVRWLAARSGLPGDVSLVVAAYGWNDPAGVLIADRGFALSDRPSTLFGGLGRPPIGFYHEIDRRPGYYVGVAFHGAAGLELRALRYDNRADPGAATDGGGGAWLTRFTSLGARWEPRGPLTLIAQYLAGDTTIGPDGAPARQYVMRFHAAFALASLEWQRHRLTVRYDDFHTRQTSGFYGPHGDEAGHGWTIGASHEFGSDWTLAAEWIRLQSRFPPRSLVSGMPDRTDTQVQLALRYQLRLDR
jgi:hypothetical protein